MAAAHVSSNLGVQGKLIAGINSRVQLYDWQLQKDSSRGLVAGAGQSGLVLALYLACRGDFIVVGKSAHFSLPMHAFLVSARCISIIPTALDTLTSCSLC